jgi:transposase InsO family protein
MSLPEGGDESHVLGAHFGEPIDVVRAETVDLPVPSTAEIVIEGHISHTESRKPKFSPAAKILDQHRGWIRSLRLRNLGSRRIQSELKRVHDFDVSRTTIEKVLRAMNVKPLSRPRRPRKGSTRYARHIPGDCVQMDTCKIAPGTYQYTAIDDCTRVRVLAIYPRRAAANSLSLLVRVIEETPFPAQAIQTDRGREFFAYCFQEKLMEYGIKFRPIRPVSPHLNGKVERSQRTDLDEFYPTIDLQSSDLPQRLQEWQDHYNQYRPHGSDSARGRVTPHKEAVYVIGTAQNLRVFRGLTWWS